MTESVSGKAARNAGNNKTPHTFRYTALCLSVKNEGYTSEPLRRLGMRRVEQCTRRLRFPSFEYTIIKHDEYDGCVK